MDFVVPPDNRKESEINNLTLLKNWKNYGTVRWQWYQEKLVRSVQLAKDWYWD